MTTKETIFCNMMINQFELPVFLGWPHDERHQTQLVSIDIHIHFATPPAACASDRLEDTFCYSWLTDQIREKIADNKFHLIEHLAQTILTITRRLVPDSTMIAVNLTKKPSIDGLKGGVTFSCVSVNESTAS